MDIRLNDARILVTGANSGIGAATTTALLTRGAEVIATVRTRSAAASVRRAHAGESVTVAILDVNDEAAARKIIDRYHPDVVVNCAGDARLGALMDLDDDQAREQFETLVIAPIRLARFAVPHQRAAGNGRIVNVSSTMGSTPLPFTGWYGAAKAALDVATDALRLELGPTGITVIRVECGAVDSPAWDTAGDDVEAGADEVTQSSRHRWVALTRWARPHFATTAEVATVIADAALDDDPEPVYRVGFGSTIPVVSSLVPTAVTDMITRALFGLRLDRRSR